MPIKANPKNSVSLRLSGEQQKLTSEENSPNEPTNQHNLIPPCLRGERTRPNEANHQHSTF